MSTPYLCSAGSSVCGARGTGQDSIDDLDSSIPPSLLPLASCYGPGPVRGTDSRQPVDGRLFSRVLAASLDFGYLVRVCVCNRATCGLWLHGISYSNFGFGFGFGLLMSLVLAFSCLSSIRTRCDECMLFLHFLLVLLVCIGIMS